MARLFDVDPVTKTKRLHHYNHADDSWHIETVQEVDDIVEANRAKFNASMGAKWGDFAQVGSIPLNVYFQLKRDGVIDQEGNVHDDKRLLKWLQDPANRAWRTRPGRLA